MVDHLREELVEAAVLTLGTLRQAADRQVSGHARLLSRGDAERHVHVAVRAGQRELGERPAAEGTGGLFFLGLLFDGFPGDALDPPLELLRDFVAVLGLEQLRGPAESGGLEVRVGRLPEPGLLL